MKNSEESHLIFSEIINCYTAVQDDKLGQLFIKHSSHLGSISSETKYISSLKEAREKKLPSEKEKLESLKSSGLWPQLKDGQIEDNIRFISSMRDMISKEYLLSKRRMLRKELEDSSKRLNSLIMEKDFFMGLTAERYAQKQSYQIQVIDSFYLNEKLTEKLSIEDCNDDEIFNRLSDIYHNYLLRINIDSIKRVAISRFFSDMFFMCGDNAFYFFGKPIVQLTHHQTNLFLYGKYFKNRMQEYGDKLPPDMADNPDDMMEFFEISKNVSDSKILEDDGKGGMFMVPGATKEDLKIMGFHPEQISNIGEDLRKSGKSMLTRDDIEKMHR
jgi:hypothetical protein